MNALLLFDPLLDLAFSVRLYETVVGHLRGGAVGFAAHKGSVWVEI